MSFLQPAPRLFLGISFLVITTLALAEISQEIARRCTDLSGGVVESCAMHLSEAAEHTDDYMRQMSEKKAMAALAERNLPLERERAAKRQAAAEAASRKATSEVRAKLQAQCSSEGMDLGSVRLGMSREANLRCGWGRPSSVSRTINVSGTHEQWVYGGRRYLYFDNGKLATIQD
jgi:hypothetical protein